MSGVLLLCDPWLPWLLWLPLIGGMLELCCPCEPPLELPWGGIPKGLLWLCCPPPELPPPIGMGMPLLPEEPPDIPPCIPPGIPGTFSGMFNPVPLGMLMVPSGGRVDSSSTEMPPPTGIPPVVIMGPPRLRL